MLRYYCQRAVKCSLQERLQQVATCTMMRVVVLLNLALLLLILVLDMVLLDMSHRVCVLLLLFVALCCYVFLITWISGHWNEQKQRMQLSPILSILVVILLFSCVIAFLQHGVWRSARVECLYIPSMHCDDDNGHGDYHRYPRAAI